MPLGHLLIEAFRIKDEAAEEIKRNPAEVASTSPGDEPLASMPVDSALTRALSGISSVQEFAIFNVQQGLQATSPGPCSIATFDVEAFAEALTAIAQDLDWSPYRSMALGTTKRNRFLLLKHQQQQLVLKLKPGAQAAPVLKEIERVVDL
jgi:hypothetical protein